MKITFGIAGITKKLTLKIQNCTECPYGHYNSYCDNNTDSGYDCHATNECCRIIDDWEWNNPRNKNRVCLREHNVPIPSWCPLENDI